MFTHTIGTKPILWINLLLLLLPSHLLLAANEQTALAHQRNLYQQATKALNANQLSRFNKINAQLSDYPLQPYLDYLLLRKRLRHTDSHTLSQFLSQHQGSFYADRLRNAWLDQLARTQQWSLLLSHYQAPQPVSRQCLRLQALIALKRYQETIAAIPTIWLVGHSQPKQCDPIFKIWKKNGLLTDSLIWQRIHLALAENHYSLASYLAKQLSEPSQAISKIKQWKQIHRSPLTLLRRLPSKTPNKQPHSLSQDTPLSRKIIQHGIARLARKSTNKAHQAWQRIAPAYTFSEQDKQHTQSDIAKKAALNHEQHALTLYGQLPAQPWRVRAALWQQNWPAVQHAIASLTPQQQQSNRWQYWLARSQAELGNPTTASATLQKLTLQRDYYSFLAADKLNQPYQMNHQPIDFTASELTTFSQRNDIAQLREFYALNMNIEARRQAYRLIHSLTPRQLQLLAILTHQWGWHYQTIVLLGKAQYWDALNLRFPLLFTTAISHAAQQHQLDPSWLLALARQESAFDPHARSAKGATGIMQLMPNTAKLIARLIKQPLKHRSKLLDPDRNIQLGSAYLSKMYRENQHNPVLATAAYNAGPYRVSRWLPEQNIPADIWIENIPFAETRKYTRNVLSYAAIFDHQRKQTITPLSARMPMIKPKKQR